MSRPVRTTIVFALASGLLVVPAAWLLQYVMPWSLAFKLVLWTDLALYAVLLARWSRTALTRLFFPLGLLLGVAVWPQTATGFFLLAMGVLSWVRSGICYRGTPLRAFFAEMVAIVGGSALVLLLGGHTTAAWALDICLFFLFQSLYFFIVPEKRSGIRETAYADPFERAMEGAARVLDEP